MAWDFKPGMKVVCVDDDIKTSTIGKANGDMGGLKEGQIYTVARVGIHFISDDVVVFLEEINRAVEWGFLAARFRPVRTTSIASIEAHLNTLPVRKTVEA
jgi:hypothetical protein